MFPFIDTAPRAARPGIVIGLIALNTIVFLWMWSLPPATLNDVLFRYALIPVRYTNPMLAREAGLDPSSWWPLLTNTFMHGGWLHLIFNMWFLWIFGPAMEARWGRLAFAILYVAGGVVASLVYLVTDPASTEPALGASGAIAAVIAAYAVTYPTKRVMTIIPLGFIPIFIPVPAVVFALAWFALQVLQASSELASPSPAGGIAWWAHIGGFAFGILFALIANRFGPVGRVPATVWTDTRGKRVPDIKPRRWSNE